MGLVPPGSVSRRFHGRAVRTPEVGFISKFHDFRSSETAVTILQAPRNRLSILSVLGRC